MQQSGDLAVDVLRVCYGASMDWVLWSTPRRGDSAFMQGLRLVFTCMQSLFQPRVGDGARFSFWEVDWPSHARFWACYPRLHTLALEPGATVRTHWNAGWSPPCPTLYRTSDMRTSLPCTQFLSHISCRRGNSTLGCGAGDVSSYTVIFKNWRALQIRLRSNAIVSS